MVIYSQKQIVFNASNFDFILHLCRTISFANGIFCISLTSQILSQTSGLYYKHITIVNDDSNFTNKWRHSLVWRSSDARVVIYDCNLFIIQATVFYSNLRLGKYETRLKVSSTSIQTKKSQLFGAPLLDKTNIRQGWKSF